MKIIQVALPISLFIWFALFSVGAKPAVINVATTDEFVAAIGSNRIIRLKPGKYLLPSECCAGNPHVEFKSVTGGSELIISGVKKLSIEGSKDALSEIIAMPRYATVLTLKEVEDVSIRNLTLRHGEPGECMGAVLGVEDSRGVTVTNSILSGSGTTGLKASHSKDLTFIDTAIRNCNSDILELHETSGVSFLRGQYEMNKGSIELTGSSSLKLEDLLVQRNDGAGDLISISEHSSVALHGMRFRDNKAERFTNNFSKLTMADTVIERSGKTGRALRGMSPEIVQTGTFHGNEIDCEDGEEWLGLYEVDKKWSLRRIRLKVKAVRDEVAGDNENQATGKELSVEGDKPLILLTGVTGAKAGPVISVLPEPLKLQPGMIKTYSLLNSRLTLTVEGTAARPADDEDDEVIRPIQNYSVLAQSNSNSSVVGKKLFSLEVINEDLDVPSLLWVGDINGDKKIDLLMTTSNHYNVARISLFVSSADAGGLVETASFQTTGC